MELERDLEAYRQQVLRHLRDYLLQAEYQSLLNKLGYSVSIEEIRLASSKDPMRLTMENEEGERDFIIITFREASRPDCLFGYQAAIEPADLVLNPPDSRANIIRTNLEEEIFAEGHGLPSTCEQENITWIP